MKTGTVKWFNSPKGYGFLSPADGGFYVFVHISAVERAGIAELTEGQKIIFDIATDEQTGEILATISAFCLICEWRKVADQVSNHSLPLRLSGG